jgi:hypothetical protein
LDLSLERRLCINRGRAAGPHDSNAGAEYGDGTKKNKRLVIGAE